MLQKEFENRIGRKVSESEYVEANAMYMLAGDDMDKDTFCREWKKIGNSALVKGLYETAYRLDKVHKDCMSIISETADALLSISDMEGTTCPIREELEHKAHYLVGIREVIKRKSRMLITLSAEEIEYVNNNLK